MNYKASDIISICETEKDNFQELSKTFTYDIKGILNSEMLFICALSKELGVRDIIESGRARGNSTEIFAKYFESNTDVTISSVELSKYSQDSIVALERLRGRYDNLSLLYGNSFFLLPRLCSKSESCTVLIDGPKGKYALILADRLLTYPSVKAVFIHDTHQDTNWRQMIERVYSNVFSSDDSEFVSRFKDLDAPCWKVYNTWEGFETWGPYTRDNVKMKSYGPTLTMILPEAGATTKLENSLNQLIDMEDTKPTASTYRVIRNKIRTIIPRKSEMRYFIKYYQAILLNKV